jgi:Stress responsive A/B Barrel Domain
MPNNRTPYYSFLVALCLIFSFSCTETFAQTMSNKLLRHVVLFKFKETSSVEDIKKVEISFRELPSKIKEIKTLEWGTNNSPENLHQGFTHCFLVTFASEKDREVYLPHSAHLAFVEVLKPHLDKVLVIDYWAQD